MPGPIAGTAVLTVDGEAFNCTTSDFRPSAPKKETLKGQTKVEGYSEMPMEGFISATVRLQPGQDITNLLGKGNATVVLVRNNGQTIYGAGMWQTEEGGTATVEGTTNVKFEGPLVTAEAASS